MMVLAESTFRENLAEFFIHWWNVLDWFLFCGAPIVLGFLGWLVGRTVEARHHRRLDELERELLTIPITDTRSVPPGIDAGGAVMIVGSVVLATDYFRTFLATLRKLIGGEIGIYQRLMLRARREAVCRLMKQAHGVGAVAVINLRIETSTIGDVSAKRGAMAEVMAYGTAVLARKGESQ